MALQSLWNLPPSQTQNQYTVGKNPWTGDQLVVWPLPTHGRTQTQDKHTYKSMPRVGFEPTVPLFEWVSTVHALDRQATVIGI
jgi:hypothetical protein